MENEMNPMNTEQPEFENVFSGTEIPEEPVIGTENVQDFWNPGQPPVEAKPTVLDRIRGLVQDIMNKLNSLGNKQKKYLLFGTVAVVAVILVFTLLGSVLQSPAAKVGVAIGNTVKEFSEVLDLWGVDNITGVLSETSNSLDLDISINDLEDEDSVLIDAGVRVMADMNMKKRNIGIQMVPYMGSADLMNAMLSADDAVIYFHSPELLPCAIGVNTETMMEDLDNLGADLGVAEDISFNLFDVLEMISEINASGEENKKALQAAGADLIESVDVQKGKKQSIRVNGSSMECNVYEVLIPQDALEAYVEVVEEIAGSVDYEEILEEILDSMNMPRSITNEILDEYSVSGPDFDGVYDLLDELGDVELKLYIKGNKVMAVKYDEEVYDSDWKVELYLGGGDRYVDNITFKFDNEYTELVIKSSGDHSAREGMFTDKTTVEVDGDKVTLQVKYDPKADSDNLSVTLKDDREAFKIKGNYRSGKSDVQLNLDKIVYEYRDEEEFDISVDLHIFKYAKRVDMSDAMLLAEMTEDDLEKLIEDIETKATGWATELVEENPELMYLF